MVLLLVNSIVQIGVRHYQHQQDLNYHYFKHACIKKVVEVRIDFLSLQPPY
jgi:hypothetical protein